MTAFHAAAHQTDVKIQQLQVRAIDRVLTLIYRTNSWRLTKPLRLLRRLFFSQTFGIDPDLCSPDLNPVPNSPGDWISTGTDPQFLIPCHLSRGWIRIRLKMTSDVPGFIELYFDTGGGCNPANQMQLTYNSGQVDVDRYIHIANSMRIIRIDPLTAPGKFHLEHFSIQTVPTLISLLRAVKAKVTNLTARGRNTKALGTAAKLIFSGNFREFKNKLLDLGPGGENPSVWRFARPTESEREALRAEAKQIANPPLISIVMPVYNTPENYLRMAIDSVFNQIYTHWELCIADDCSPSPHVRKILDEYAARDSRIKVTYRKKNGHIAAASNTALELVTGEYAGLLDHDDELAEIALLKMAQAIAADRSVDMLYSDEDKLSLAGEHFDPFFKPDWSPEYFLACMYTCHLGVYRTTLLREINGFRSDFDTAQDYDLVLRLTAKTTRVKHVPEVLYHWRAIPTSTASGHSAKPQAHDFAQRALKDYLGASGFPGSVEAGPAPGFHRIRYAIRGRPLVSIIIPSACRPLKIDGRESSHVIRCVESIFKKSTYKDFEVLIVDRNEMPPSMQSRFEKLGVKRVTYDVAFNWSLVNNLGVKASKGTHYLFLNDDMEVINPDWLESLLEFSQQPAIGAVGAKLMFPNGRLQHVGVTVLGSNPKHMYYGAAGSEPGYFNSNVVHRNLSAVTGACLMTRADVFRELNGFTEELPYNYNDVDYCLKVISSGKRVVYTPYAQLFHYESATKTGTYPSEVLEFQRRWAKKFPTDPFCPASAQLMAVPQ